MRKGGRRRGKEKSWTERKDFRKRKREMEETELEFERGIELNEET